MSCLLRANQLGLVENMTMLLTPFEQLTREISSRLATTVDVIPSVVALKHLLSKAADTDNGVRTAKNTLLEAVNKQFGSTFSVPLYYLSTILDPRYKDRYFDTVTMQRHNVKRKNRHWECHRFPQISNILYATDATIY